MKVLFDPGADAVYLQLADEIGRGGVARTYMCDPIEVNGMINLKFDAAGQLVGIEILDAHSKIPASLLETAERYS